MQGSTLKKNISKEQRVICLSLRRCPCWEKLSNVKMLVRFLLHNFLHNHMRYIYRQIYDLKGKKFSVLIKLVFLLFFFFYKL